MKCFVYFDFFFFPHPNSVYDCFLELQTRVKTQFDETGNTNKTIVTTMTVLDLYMQSRANICQIDHMLA